MELLEDHTTIVAAAKKQQPYIPLDSLIVLERNPKKHDIDSIRASFTRYGFNDPVLVNFNCHLLSGHGRIETLKIIRQWGDEPPENVLINEDGLWIVPFSPVSIPEEEEEAFAITVNRTVENGGWKDEYLAAILRDLSDRGALEGTGYNQKELEEIENMLKLSEKSKENEEELEEEEELPPGAPITVQRGDMFKLGTNYLLCGDSTDQFDLDRLFSLVKRTPHMMWADPPYGQKYKSNMRTKFESLAEKAQFDEIEGDESPLVEFMDYTKNIPVWYVCGRWDNAHIMRQAIRDRGFDILNRIAWYKPGGGAGDLKRAYIFNHEDIWYSQKHGANIEFQETREADVWQVSKDSGISYRHPNQKPIELISKAFRQHCPPDGIVFDPFVGGGSSILTAAQWPYRITVLGMELDPQHVQTTLEAYYAATGISPVLMGRQV